MSNVSIEYFIFCKYHDYSSHIDQQALKFRKFWGEKAELRQFKDGKIAESTGNAAIYAL